MKYFVISDIHAHFDVMFLALQKAGYDSQNSNHHLLVLGDLFDRGKQANEVLQFLYPLNMQEKATIILGNHDSFLLDFLNGHHDKAYFNSLYNGFGETLYALSGKQPEFEHFQDTQTIIEDRYPYLRNWLQSFPLYLEIKDYIFVHGGIDGGMLDWKTMSVQRDFIWNREIELPKIPGKTVVAGHHRVATIRKKTNDYHKLFLYNPELFDILYEDGKILIDRFVEVSNEINVLILDL